MKKNIEIVSKKIERKDGFYQSKYFDKINNIQILIHYCLKNVKLDRHKHTHTQFGYNFYGKYEFIIDKDLIYIDDNSNYLINEYISHEALAITDYYSIDIKFYSNNFKYDKVLNMPLSSNNLIKLEANNSIIIIKKLYSNNKIKRNTFLITSAKIDILIDNISTTIEPLNIYKITKNCNININTYDKVLAIEIM